MKIVIEVVEVWPDKFQAAAFRNQYGERQVIATSCLTRSPSLALRELIEVDENADALDCNGDKAASAADYYKPVSTRSARRTSLGS